MNVERAFIAFLLGEEPPRRAPVFKNRRMRAGLLRIVDHQVKRKPELFSGRRVTWSLEQTEPAMALKAGPESLDPELARFLPNHLWLRLSVRD
ncbi:MAG TPA: hypothetical protein VJ123_00240 [Anaerolineales bacterium]|nr:hypothetical protein [Anaerolineales bacterium]